MQKIFRLSRFFPFFFRPDGSIQDNHTSHEKVLVEDAKHYFTRYSVPKIIDDEKLYINFDEATQYMSPVVSVCKVS
jgi:hypothetical protein